MQAPALSPPPVPRADPRRRRRWKSGLGVAVAVGVGLWLWLKPSAAAPSVARVAGPIPVLAGPVVKGPLPHYLNALGTVTSQAQVVVQSRVDGQLMQIHFTEGQTVSAEDLLAEIDPRPFAAKVAQAEGQLRKAEAQLKNARLDLERMRALLGQKAISEQAFVAQEAAVAASEGTVMSDQASLDEARLQLAYCRITAPIPGRVGFRRVDAGNLVRTGDPTGIVTITQLDPITVVFTLPQDALPPVLERFAAGASLTAEIYDRDRRLLLAKGALTSVDNAIDAATGTLRCKALVDNSNNRLYPNQFVTVRLLVDTQPEATLAPVEAIQRGAQQSTFVYRIDEVSSSASLRPVKLGSAEKGMVEVREGLAPGDWVALEGVDRLQNGSKVLLKKTVPTTP